MQPDEILRGNLSVQRFYTTGMGGPLSRSGAFAGFCKRFVKANIRLKLTTGPKNNGRDKPGHHERKPALRAVYFHSIFFTS
jgi:hypothetical protein